MSVHSGARQWRHQCDCAPDDVGDDGATKDWRMHSQVSENNLGYFITEDRVSEELTEDELREIYDQRDGSIIVCNVCGSVKDVRT